MNLKNSEIKDKFDVTLVSLVYNQADVILEHLNSILFQKIKFINESKVQLIISDDASSDNTVDLVKSWIELNKSNFDSISLLISDKNQGTCKSFVKSIKLARGKHVKALAGDDVYLKNDLSKIFSMLDFHDIVLTPSLPFYENNLSNISELKFDKSKFAIKQYTSIGYKKIKKRLISAPETPGAFFNRGVFTEGVLDFISRFDLIEDRSFWISVLEENDLLNIGFQEEAYVGYRQHAASVSRGGPSAATIRYKLDQKKLGAYQVKNSKSSIYKMVHLYNLYFNQVDFRYKNILNLSAICFNLNFFLYIALDRIKKL